MIVTLVMVISVDGKITRGESPAIYQWTSVEDQAHFNQLKKQHQVIIMGSQTYQAARQVLTLTDGTLRLVMTRKPATYAADTQTGQLEFTAETPMDLCQRLQQAGYEQVLVVGGGEINSLFFNQGIIDEIFLTVEPVVFGRGKALVKSLECEVALQAISVKQLNQPGTLLFHYRVIKG